MMCDKLDPDRLLSVKNLCDKKNKQKQNNTKKNYAN